jgi:hypothetical protein
MFDLDEPEKHMSSRNNSSAFMFSIFNYEYALVIISHVERKLAGDNFC